MHSCGPSAPTSSTPTTRPHTACSARSSTATLISSRAGAPTSRPARPAPRLWRPLLRFAYGRADAAAATSRFLAEATRPFLPPGRPITITPFGVDLDRFPFRPAPARERVAVGAARFRLEPIYGLHHLVAAFAAVADRRARLVVYGDGPQRPALERQAAALGLADRVSFPGRLPHERLPAALDALDLFAMPSIVPEAFGVAAVEASAVGLPVVASAVGGLPEVVEDGQDRLPRPAGRRAPPADRLSALIADRDLRARLGAAGPVSGDPVLRLARASRSFGDALRGPRKGRKAT